MVDVSDLLEISDEIRKEALKRANLSEEDVRKGVSNIIDYFNGQPILSSLKLDPRHVESLFIKKKGCVEGAKQTLINYYFLKTAVPEIFLNRDPALKQIKENRKAMAFGLQYKVDDGGCKYVTLEFYDSPEVFDVFAFYKMFFMVFDIKLRYDYTSDMCIIFDMRNFSKDIMNKLSLDILRKIHYAVPEAYGLVILCLHFLYPPEFAAPFIQNYRSVMRKETKVLIHKDLESLWRCIERKKMPKKLGGEQREVLEIWDLWTEKLVEFGPSFLKEDELFKV